MIPTLGNRTMPAAALARANGWGVGTRLRGDAGHGPTVIRITALGEAVLLAVTEVSMGRRVDTLLESCWVLDHRDWQETA